MPLEQLTLKGIRAVKGFSPVKGRPGLWSVVPSQVNDTTIINNAAKSALNEFEQARKTGGLRAIQHARMHLGALDDIAQAQRMSRWMHEQEPTRGLLQMDKNGRIIGAAVVDLEKGKQKLLGQVKAGSDEELFRELSPLYLEHVSVLTPEARGNDLLRTLQELYGDQMVFQVSDPANNAEIYKRMGAQPLPRGVHGEDVLGDEDLPAHFIERRIVQQKPSAEEKQMPLPGFRQGGLLQHNRSINR